MKDARRAGVPPPYSAHRTLVLALARENRVADMMTAWDHLRQCKMRPDEEIKGALTEALLRAGQLQTIADLGEHHKIGYVASEKLMRWARSEYAKVQLRLFVCVLC